LYSGEREKRQMAGMKMHPCSMALDITEWSESDLVEDLFDEPLGPEALVEAGIAAKRAIPADLR